MGYLGNNSTLTGTQNNVRISATATADQTDFTVGGGYQVGAIDVYRNGVKLNAGNDFTASNGSTVTLVGAAGAGDTIEFVVFESFEVSGAVSKNGDSTIQGALTATSFSGDGSSVTGVSADGLSATASVNTTGIITASNGFSGNVSGVAATFTGPVTIGGTLTYEDVTNIDSVGLVTARNGLQVLAGITTISGQTNLTNTNVTAGILSATGQTNLANVNVSASSTAVTSTVTGQTTLANVNVATGIATVAGQTNLANVNVATGIATVAGQTNLANVNVSAGVTVSGMTSAAGGFRAQGVLVEAFSSTTTAWSSNANLNISNGNLQFCSANLGGTNNTLNIRSNTGINTDLAVGQAINVTAITAVNATSAYVNHITLDGVAVTESWVGGSAPTAGGGSGYDTYSFNILKLGDNTFTVIANHIKTSA